MTAAKPRPRSAPAPTAPRTASRVAVWSPPAWLVWAAPIAALLAVHGGALAGFFAADDIDFLMRVRGMDATPWPLARLLPGAWRWQAMTAAFGAQPLPHLALALALHGASALLLTRIVQRAGLGSASAMLAGVLMAGTSIAYASTHWASGLGEVLAAALALTSLTLHLECRHRMQPALAVLAGVAAALAVLSKESAILAPVAILLADRLMPVRAEGRGAMREVLVGGGLGAAIAVGLYLRDPHVGGEAYALAVSPAVWLGNLGTYAAWLAMVTDPIRDRVAQSDAALLAPGLAVLAAWGVAALLERSARSRPVTAGFAWFVLLLAPVLLLANHTYLYYLVLPWAGAALAVAGLLGRAAARLPAAAAAVVVAVAAGGFVANEALQLRARQRMDVSGLKMDRIARESEILRNAVTSLRAASLAPGDSIAFVNPFPMLSMDASRGEVHADATSLSEYAYIPFVLATREGRALSLFVPGPVIVGVSDGVRRDWEGVRFFRYANDGTLTDIGSGADALFELSADYLQGERWDYARLASLRLIELGRDDAEVRWRLGRALGQLGDERGALEQAQLLIARWPDSPRAVSLRENAARLGVQPSAPAPAAR